MILSLFNYAAAALQGEMCCQDEVNIGYVEKTEHAGTVARKCYMMADAMLIARNS